MQGAIIACSEHRQVHNASTRKWQEVSQETFDELMAMAREMEDVVVYEGCCSICSEAVSQSLASLYHYRYAAAMQKELGYDIRPPYDASEE